MKSVLIFFVKVFRWLQRQLGCKRNKHRLLVVTQYNRSCGKLYCRICQEFFFVDTKAKPSIFVPWEDEKNYKHPRHRNRKQKRRSK